MNIEQLDIFSSGDQLRDDGINRAINHANSDHPNWSDLAYQFLLVFIRSNPEFMTEDVVNASTIPEPPEKRAWGGVIRRALNAGLIERKGFGKSKNPLHHSAPKSIWKRK